VISIELCFGREVFNFLNIKIKNCSLQRLVKRGETERNYASKPTRSLV